jgi:amidohydrolase
MEKTDSSLRDWLSEIRREFHKYPEVSNQEYRTSDRIVEILAELGVESRRMDGITGVIGLIPGTDPGPCIGLRADIDALPVQELGDAAYRSVNDGVMHACGHDANTAIMLGTAKKIVDSGVMKTRSGCVKLLFQPAEERGQGAKAMIAGGALDAPRVDCVIAGHMAPDLEVGTVGVFRGLGYASSNRFELEISGQGTHGARPEEGNDPVVAGAYFVTLIQSIVSRNIKPTEAAVVSVGKFIAGSAANVIPASAILEGTVRALSETVRRRVLSRLEAIAAGLEQTFQVRCRLVLKKGLPPCVNDIPTADMLYSASKDVLGEENACVLPPIMGSEDFSYFTLQRPSAIMRLGCANREKGIAHPLHSPFFDIDERVLEIGVEIFSRAVGMYLPR